MAEHDERTEAIAHAIQSVLVEHEQIMEPKFLREKLIPPILEVLDGRSADVCPLCRDIGWLLEDNAVSKPGPRMLELLPCLLPDCEKSGRDLQGINFTTVRFVSVSRNPRPPHQVMSVSGGVFA